MGRPRTISDRELLAVARQCIVEQGPGVPLSTIARRAGITPGGLVKRFGTKERLVFLALLPQRPPAWLELLSEPPPDDVQGALTELLVQLAEEFTEVGPAFAALRMGGHDVAVAIGDGPGPFAAVRSMLARWLTAAGVASDVDVLADAAVGAAEARGFTRWIGSGLVHPPDDRVWASGLASLVARNVDAPQHKNGGCREEIQRGSS